MVWWCTVWFGYLPLILDFILVRSGSAWLGTEWYGLVRFGEVWAFHRLLRLGTEWCGWVRYG